MNQFRVIAAVAITGLVGVLPAAAQGKSGSHGGGATTHGRPTTTTSSGAETTTTHGKSAEAGSKAADVKSGKKTATTSTTTTAGATTTGTNALATKISSNPDQLARITAMLPKDMTLDQATAGFRNQGQFIAALNASKNQGVPFADLQKAMTVNGMSLGQAVKSLKPSAPTSTTTGTGSTTTGTSTTPTTTTTSTTSAS